MLCSGTTISETRETMVGYLNAMYEEMMEWSQRKQCRFEDAGDDQAIHNYLYYSGKLNHLDPRVYRPREGIVNTVGVIGTKIMKSHWATHRGQNNDKKQNDNKKTSPNDIPLAGATHKKGSKRGSWIGPEYDFTDENGYFVNWDGSKSPVIHQYDRWGRVYSAWLADQEGVLWD